MLDYIRKHIWSELPPATPRQRVLAGVLWSAALIAFALWTAWQRQRHGLPIGHAPRSLAVIGLLLGAFLLLTATGPAVYLWTMRVLSIFGFVVSNLVLVAAFYLIVTPMGWVLRAMGKDFLQLRHTAPAWKERHGEVERKRYYRLF